MQRLRSGGGHGQKSNKPELQQHRRRGVAGLEVRGRDVPGRPRRAGHLVLLDVHARGPPEAGAALRGHGDHGALHARVPGARAAGPVAEPATPLALLLDLLQPCVGVAPRSGRCLAIVPNPRVAEVALLVRERRVVPARGVRAGAHEGRRDAGVLALVGGHVAHGLLRVGQSYLLAVALHEVHLAALLRHVARRANEERPTGCRVPLADVGQQVGVHARDAQEVGVRTCAVVRRHAPGEQGLPPCGRGVAEEGCGAHLLPVCEVLDVRRHDAAQVGVVKDGVEDAPVLARQLLHLQGVRVTPEGVGEEDSVIGLAHAPHRGVVLAESEGGIHASGEEHHGLLAHRGGADGDAGAEDLGRPPQRRGEVRAATFP
mmetsp:Transcript_77054/g.213558  ORF Transcript_77054/g.213558 Transcript_77054/m.213558 type:complete len:373 (+) Transcript_77054:230-1348(+)